MGRIWERYFIWDVLKVFLLFMGTFYFLYVAVDYSTNSSSFASRGMGVGDIAFYYLCHFIKRLEVLLPFSLMMATLRTLCTLNINNEIVALVASGVTLKRLTRPFLLIALVCVGLMYLNFEYALPGALKALKEQKMKRRRAKGVKPQTSSVSSFVLKDGSTLLYQDYDKERERFYDVYWVKNADELYRIKYLYPDELHSVGTLVDHLARTVTGQFRIVESIQSHVFDDLGFTEDILGKALSKPDRMPISKLWKERPVNERVLTDYDMEVVSNLHQKLSMPWLALLVVLVPIPYCVRFTRHLQIFFLLGAAVVGFIAFFTILNAAVVLSESQVIPAHLGSWGTFFVFYLIALWQYVRLK